MALKLVAKYSKAFSNDKADCYIADIGEDESVDFWFPKGAKPTSADIFVEFEGEDDGEN